ncbi:MAG: 3'-5' exonuclease domain-containing protein 2 [Burkholderiales bacterium]|nr:3'-5' exonuclease domain-containing protein 2 [Burkholderiales bacterium]
MCATEVAALLRAPAKRAAGAVPEPAATEQTADTSQQVAATSAVPSTAVTAAPRGVPAHSPTPRAALPSRDAIDALPPFDALPLARIQVPQTREQFAQAVEQLLAERYIGFDTESKPTFARGEAATGPHVVQFAKRDAAWLFQVHNAASRDALAAVLASGSTVKVGFGLRSDRGHIRARLGTPLHTVLDLTTWFRRQGYRNEVGVKTAVAMVLQQRFVKSKRWSTSNWAAAQLSEGQCVYAANDAYGALAVLHALLAQGHREADLPIIEQDA